MIRWKLYDNNPVRDMLEQMLQVAAQSPQRQGRGEPMPINVHQNEAEVFVDAALPGVRPDDIDINCDDGVLTLRAKAMVEDREYFHQEIRPIEYLRQVMLPVDCRFEDARASFEHGLLEIRIPKRQAKAPEKIHIQVNRSAGPTTIEAAKGEGYSEVRPMGQEGPGRTNPPASRANRAAPPSAVKAGSRPGAASGKPSGGAGASRGAGPAPKRAPSR